MNARLPDTDDVHEVARLFMEAMHAMMQSSAGTDIELMNESGLTLPQLIALHVLRSHGPKSVGDIAGCVKLSKAATSHMVERLVRLGLVGRVESAEDRRQKRVTFHPSAASLLDRLIAARRDSISSALRRLSPSTRKAISRAMRGVLSDLEDCGHCAGGER